MNNNTNNQLIERYVYAVIRQLPSKQRKDIEQELTSLINDMLEERCGDITPTERDVNVVLAELGKPSELAAKYDPDGERSLIGPRYFRRYVQTLKVVLPAALIGMVIAAVLSILVNGMQERHWILEAALWLGNIVSTVISAAVMVTAVFAIFEYKGVSLDEDDISKLPAVPKDNQRIKRSDCIAGIVFTVIVLAIFVFAPQLFCIGGSITSAGEARFVPFFNDDVMRGLWFCWVGVFLLGIAREVFGLFEGVYTLRYAVFSAVANVLGAVGVAYALTRQGIVNPECAEFVRQVFANESAELTAVFEHFNIFLLAVWCLALLADTAKAFIKYFRYRNEA